jgi:hypothetical protein
MKHRRVASAVAALSLMAGLGGAGAAHASVIKINEFKLSNTQLGQLRARWVKQIYANHKMGTWAPMKFNLSDADLKIMGLPSKKVLLAHRYKTPTAFKNGRLVRLGAKGKGKGTKADGPAVASFAGTGFFGIRPGAWLLFIDTNAGSVGWCSAAHVYGSPGAYSISTAGHCGKVGQTATVIGAVGNDTPVLIDFGKFTASTGDAGIGKDWALIGVDSTWQSLVTPTMAFWGGPIGSYKATGEVVSADLSKGDLAVTPNPTLVQDIVHYGHGAGAGAGGTPRTALALNWRSNYFTAFGVITPGDSGSGSNTLTGDAIGANRQAAGINTHIYVDSSLATGLGTFAGTRVTLVGTPANGQIVPYPAPVPGAP